jgi:DNA polymerase-1
MAINTTIQGSAADLMKLAMLNVHNRLSREKLRAKLILQVHDELVVEAESQDIQTATEILKFEMENAFKLSVPLVVDISVGKNWDEAH